MKVIRIDNDVWKFLKQHAVPLEDNPNTVLRRILGIDVKEKKTKNTKRLPRGSGRTDQKAFMEPILDILRDAGGEAPISDIFKRLETRMKHQLKPIDFEKLKSGQVRWRNTAQWARNELFTEGFLEKAPRGIWKLSKKGRQDNGASLSSR